jgi:Spy/CpxP family protein refolding chaperone
MLSRRILIPLVLAALMVPFALAQDNTGNQGGDQGRGRGGPGGPGGFDPAAMRQRALDRVKEQMGDVKEDEWKVIEGKLTPVMEKRFEVMAAGFGGFGRGGRGGRGGDNNQPERPARNAVEQASRDLNKVLEDKGATEDQVKEKLAAYREARDKVRAELASAQKELKEVVMPRQEAVLVSDGYLD